MIRVGIILKDETFEVKCYAEDIVKEFALHYKDIEAVVMKLPSHPITNLDAVITIGGDGTFLHTVSQLDHQVPILGVNKGNVGFLTEFDFGEPVGNLCTFFKYPRVERRMRISAYISISGRILGTALNEIAFLTSTPGRLIEPLIIIDGVESLRFRGDGLLISTPTGSTAYAMSAGGPIVDPLIDGFIVVPIAPYLLSARPQIVASSREMKIEIVSGEWLLKIDGDYCECYEDDVIRIEKSPEPAEFIETDNSFFEKVNKKLRRY